MPVNKIVATKRGRAAIAGALALALTSGYAAFMGGVPAVTPATTRAAIEQGITPPAVSLAVDRLIKPWEGLVLRSHWDPFAKIWDICYGETRINGKPVTAGMSFTPAECDAMLQRRVTRDYYLPLVDGAKGFLDAPVSVQAALISGAYNFGVGAALKSTAARRITERRYREACEAQTAFNKAGGRVVNGLVKRREMGDTQRLGEAELCVSGLQ
ncbi:lysozyme [Aureimonas sp. AU40]|uniref:lysozyme n=1 Tax=Aureimonas sp. AU40 TaxID=1637747 RepID=UPI000780CC68|nr:lysozyme [Aureimonas sp. AU40]